eukprot:evm.model.scf_167.18 EVM.evm.TU.scf_167.18   scf_167:116551-119421(-)
MSADAIRVNAHALALVLKAAEPRAPLVDYHAALGPLLVKGHPQIAETRAFLGDLTECRRNLLSALRTTDSDAKAVDASLAAYLSKLQHLIRPLEGHGTQSPEPGPPWADAGVAAAVSVEWRHALNEGAGAEARMARADAAQPRGDVRFEMASVLLSVAMWKASKAAAVVCGVATGADNSLVAQAHQLYREAAGVVQHLSDKHVEGLGAQKAGDLDENILAGLYKFMLAEAESLTVLRAIEKGNVSSLIAGLALDVSQLYAQAFESVQRAVAPTVQALQDSAPHRRAHSRTSSQDMGVKGWTGYCRKFGSYLRYKAACFKSCMLAYHALDRMQATQGGDAVRLSQEADQILRTAAILGREYDGLPPNASDYQRQTFAFHLSDRVTKIEAQCQKDNVSVYMQKVPDTLPELPEAKQLVSAIDYSLPPPEPSIDYSLFSCFDLTQSSEHVVDVVEEGKPVVEKQEGAWWRWLLAAFAIPFLVVASVLGMLVWIILLPVKLFCCPLGFAAQLMWDITEWVIKAPARVALWASGKPWKPEKRDVRNLESTRSLTMGQIPSS